MQISIQVQKLRQNAPPYPTHPPLSAATWLLSKRRWTRLPYRIGYPKLPVFPVTTEVVTGQSVDLRREILKILANHHIPHRGMFLAPRVNRRADLADCKPTLVLVSTYQHGCRDDWVNAVSDVIRTLEGFGMNCPIELVDEQTSSGLLSTEPILSTDLALKTAGRRFCLISLPVLGSKAG
jgi:hypothetical protein